MFNYLQTEPAPIKPVMRVDVYSHHITLSNYGDPIRQILLQYCRRLGRWGVVSVGRQMFKRQIVAVFAASTRDRTEFRFNLTQMDDVLRYVASQGYPSDQFEIIEHALYEPKKVTFKSTSKTVARDYQIPAIDYLIAPGKTKVLELQTGKGKTASTLLAIKEIRERTVLVIKGAYVDQWIKAAKNELGLHKRGELLVVRGADSLRGLIAMALDGELKAKFIIITSKTFYNYLRSYEKDRCVADEYGCVPEKFYETLQVGVRIIDEVHQEFHANFRQDLYAHVPKTISLSATLDADDSFLNRMYLVMFPAEIRPEKLEYDKYIDVLALQYRITDLKRVRYTGANKMYSHTRFEQSIMRYPDLLSRYFNMIYDIVRREFVENFEYGQKMLVFCATVDMCTGLTHFLNKRLPDIAIGRYVQEDAYVTSIQNTIIVSTLQSAGTYIDIAGLSTVLMTVNVDSKQANVQALGRLRRLKDWPDLHPRFIYLYAGNIDKHVDYHRKKEDKLRGKVASYNSLLTNFHV